MVTEVSPQPTARQRSVLAKLKQHILPGEFEVSTLRPESIVANCPDFGGTVTTFVPLPCVPPISNDCPDFSKGLAFQLDTGTGCGHRVTAFFRRSQIVTPVAADTTASMGVTDPSLLLHDSL